MKPIQNYEEKYSIDEFGKVYSHLTNQYLKPQINTNGYLTISLQGKIHRVHRLVAQVFVPNLANDPSVDHIDGNKLNNHKSNLRWCSHKENCSWACDERMTKSGSKNKVFYLDDVKHESLYAAAKWLAITYDKKLDTVRRELRRTSRKTIYGHRITRG